jgi:hypothetical protein
MLVKAGLNLTVLRWRLRDRLVSEAFFELAVVSGIAHAAHDFFVKDENFQQVPKALIRHFLACRVPSISPCCRSNDMVHATAETATLSVAQIIEHHNGLLDSFDASGHKMTGTPAYGQSTLLSVEDFNTSLFYVRFS